jgi:hypothetical protein
MHLTGDQWGVMNETGSYPGQPWLWLYQMWYHISPFQYSASADVWAIYLTGICTILLLLVPFIPGLRDIPRYLPVYRLVWRNWYRSPGATGTPNELGFTATDEASTMTAITGTASSPAGSLHDAGGPSDQP